MLNYTAIGHTVIRLSTQFNSRPRSKFNFTCRSELT